MASGSISDHDLLRSKLGDKSQVNQKHRFRLPGNGHRHEPCREKKLVEFPWDKKKECREMGQVPLVWL